MSSPKVVLSSRSPRSNWLLASAAVCLFIVTAAGMYELGLSNAGFSRTSAMGISTQLEIEKRELEQKNKELRARFAVLETASKVDKEAYRQVESQLVDLQQQILEQQENIEFYKGIVNENDGTGLRIQDFRLSPAVGAGKYDLRLVLAQAFRSTRQVSGKVEVVVEGVRAGKAERLGLKELAPEASSGAGEDRLAYSFRYFQDINAELVIPEDFLPERVRVIVHPKEKSSKTVEDIFVWDVKAG